jgi:hypothetical protein
MFRVIENKFRKNLHKHLCLESSDQSKNSIDRMLACSLKRLEKHTTIIICPLFLKRLKVFNAEFMSDSLHLEYLQHYINALLLS